MDRKTLLAAGLLGGAALGVGIFLYSAQAPPIEGVGAAVESIEVS